MPDTLLPLIIPAPKSFNLSATARFFRFSDAEIVDTLDGGRYRRLFQLSSFSSATSLHLVTVETAKATSNTASLRNAPGLSLTFLPEADDRARNHAAQIVASMFSTRHDLRGFRRLTKQDAVLGAVERAHRGLHLPRYASLFEALTVSILLQQIATAVAVVLKRRFVERFGERIEVEGQYFFAFPSPERIAGAEHTELRSLGLSGAKAQSILDLARFMLSAPAFADELAAEDNETIIERLSTLRGVGRWTAEWALMLYFGRTDVFPAGDLALRAIASKYYSGGGQFTESALRRFALERWGVWASYACIYLFAGLRAGLLTLERQRIARVLSSSS